MHVPDVPIIICTDGSRKASIELCGCRYPGSDPDLVFCGLQDQPSRLAFTSLELRPGRLKLIATGGSSSGSTTDKAHHRTTLGGRCDAYCSAIVRLHHSIWERVWAHCGRGVKQSRKNASKGRKFAFIHHGLKTCRKLCTSPSFPIFCSSASVLSSRFRRDTVVSTISRVH